MQIARPSQRSQTCNRNFQPPRFRSSQPYRARHHRRWPLQPVYPGRILIASRLPHRALAAGRFFHLSPHGVQIVRRRDHRKQQNQHTSQRQQTLQRRYPARHPRSRIPPPQPVSRHRQQHPCEIEQQFHTYQSEPARARSARTRPTKPKPFLQKLQIQVNVTTVPASHSEVRSPKSEVRSSKPEARTRPYGPTTTCSATGVCILCR